MEQSPRLARALADGLGVTTGELRKMAEAGLLTSDTVIKALQGQSQTVATEFSKLPPTVGRALQDLDAVDAVRRRDRQGHGRERGGCDGHQRGVEQPAHHRGPADRCGAGDGSVHRAAPGAALPGIGTAARAAASAVRGQQRANGGSGHCRRDGRCRRGPFCRHPGDPAHFHAGGHRRQLQGHQDVDRGERCQAGGLQGPHGGIGTRREAAGGHCQGGGG
ncbi:tape measure protein [Acidovorax citrulli]|nr:tape measure protein [Paracidovorax citrulli]